MLEEVLAHGGDALRQQQAVLEVVGLVAPARLGRRQDFSRSGIRDLLADQVGFVHTRLALRPRLVVQEDVAADDLAGRQVAVVDALAHVVLVHGLAEVAEIVRGDLSVGLRLSALLGPLDLARCGREADLDGIGIAREDLRPFAPGRTMALVDHDVAEVVLRVIGRQEVRVGLVGVHVQRLVGRDEDARVLLRLAARHLRRVGAEDVLEGAEPLAP